MGRDTGIAENKQANQQYMKMQQDQLQRVNAATDSFNQQLAKLRSGGSIAENPYAAPDYLRNQNILTGAATSAANKSGQELLDSDALRSGSNTSSRKATIADLSRNAMRARGDAAATRQGQDYDRYLDWQKFILGSTLAPTGVDTSMFSTQTSGRNASTGNLAQLGVAAQQSWGNILGSALGSIGTIGSAGIGKIPCWIAAELYGGWNVLPTRLIREWLSTEFVKNPLGAVLVALYRRYGQQVARRMRHSAALKAIFRPVFNLALDRALTWKLEG